MAYMKDTLTQEGTRVILRSQCEDLSEGDIGTFCGVATDLNDGGAQLKVEFEYSEDLRSVVHHCT